MKLPIPKSPSREELRGIHATLKLLADQGDTEARQQQGEVAALMRALYPRVAPAGIAGKPRRKRPKRGLILGEDCILLTREGKPTCSLCGGTGHMRLVGKRLLPMRPGQPTIDYAGQVCDQPCSRCGGSGREQVAAAEHDPVGTTLHDRPIKTEKPIRGEWAQQTPQRSGPGPVRGHARSHHRGFIGAPSRFIGPVRPEERREAEGWYAAGMVIDQNLPTTRGWHLRVGADPADLSAAIEGQACARLQSLTASPAVDRMQPRGRRLLNSRREPILTPRQQKRVRQEDMARTWQGIHNRHNRRETPWLRRGRDDWMLEMAAKLGIDPRTLTGEAQAPKAEPDEIVYAIRRGDLPPDPEIPVDPAVVERGIVGPFGEVAGKRAVQAAEVGRACVYRPDGRVEWVERAIRLTFEDGAVEVYALEDIE